VVRSPSRLVNYTLHESCVARPCGPARCCATRWYSTGWSTFVRLRALALRRDSGGCKCLHVLSSFQRTGTAHPSLNRTPEAHGRARRGRASLRVFLLRGNLPILL